MRLPRSVTSALAIASFCSGLFFAPVPNAAQNPLLLKPDKPNPPAPLPFKGRGEEAPFPALASEEISPLPISPLPASGRGAGGRGVLRTQQTSPPASPVGQQILQELVQCVRNTVPTAQLSSLEELQSASTQCVFKVVMLAPDGSVRPDANDRMIALVKATGVTLPKPSSQGNAEVSLAPVPEQKLFALSVTFGGQPRTFLLDTGASNSIIDRQVVEQLNIPGTPIPDELLQYFVVGNNCSNVNASVHQIPPLAVDAAKVQGLTGMALPKTAIPANASGVLGMDFLSEFDVIVNPKTLQLQLLPPSKSWPGAIPLEGKMGVMAAKVTINNQGPFTFLLDTGAGAMVVSKRLAERLSLNIASAQPVEVQGFCGTETGRKTTLERVSLQQHEATNLEAVILESRVLDLLGVEGIIGQNFLNGYQQHWRFGKRNELGFPEEGSLVLTPL